MRPAPPASSLRAAANATGELPAVAVEVAVVVGAGPADTVATTVALVTHPGVAARFDEVASRKGSGWLLPHDGKRLTRALSVLATTAGGRIWWSAKPGTSTRQGLRKALVSHPCLDALLHPRLGRPPARQLAGRFELRAGTNGRLHVTATGGGILKGHVSASRTVRDIAGTAGVLDAALRVGVPVYDATYPHWGQLRAAVASTSVALAVPGAPGLLSWVSAGEADESGEAPTWRAGILHPALALWDLFDDEDRLNRRLAAHPGVLDAAEAAGAVTVGWAGLFPHQDDFVARHLASRRGTVCAHPPGTGKTPTAAVALREAHRQADRRAGWVAVVAVPAGVVRQWRDELGRWFPDAVVCDAHVTTGELTSVPPSSTPKIILDTFDRIAAAELASRGVIYDEVVCDEATVLVGQGRRATALWQLRGACRRGLALTGTPAHKGDVDSTGRVVAWALGERHLFDDARLSDASAVAGMPWQDRLGPTLGTFDPAALLPPVQVSCEPALPTEHLEGALVDAVDGRLAAAWSRAAQLRDALLAGHGVGQARRGLRAEASAARLAVLTAARSARAVAADPSAAAVCLPTTLRADPVCVAAAEDLLASGCGVTELGRRARLVDHLVTAGAGVGILVFSDSLTAGEAAATALRARGRFVGVADGSSAAKRDAAAKAFRAGALDVVVVSGAGSIGMNLQAAELVCHLDGMSDVGVARQRHGRAARLDAAATAILAWAPPPAGFSGWLTRTVRDELAGASSVGTPGSMGGAVADWMEHTRTAL